MNIDNKIIKGLRSEVITFLLWDELFDSCYRTKNIELIEKVRNAEVVCLTDAEKTLLSIKKDQLQVRIEELTEIKIKQKTRD